MLLLKPVSWIYCMVTIVRNWCYDRQLFKIQSVKPRVISVGNITAGGNAKTPMTEYLVRYFQSRNKATGVLSRGYKRSTRNTQIVSDGNRLFGTARTMGDESYQIARKFPTAFVMVDENRFRGAATMTELFHPDTIILDDAFQHRRISRNLDIVMIDGAELLRGASLLPAGSLREPLPQLRRAGCIIVTNCDGGFSQVLALVRKYSDAPCLHAKIVPVRLVNISNGISCRIGELSLVTSVVFCAIAKPATFLSTLAECGIIVKSFQSFDDHHYFSEQDLERIGRLFQTSGASMIITTEKDASRFDMDRLPEIFPSESCYYLEIEMHLLDGKDEFHALLERAMRDAA